MKVMTSIRHAQDIESQRINSIKIPIKDVFTDEEFRNEYHTMQASAAFACVPCNSLEPAQFSAHMCLLLPVS